MSGGDVVDVLSQRMGSRRSVPDGARVALVIEGGGMRGIVSAAMACALEDAGILDVVDIVVGTSSGAVNAAATVTGVIGAFADSYSSIFSSREFIDLRRVLRGRPVVDGPLIVAHLESLFDLGGHLDARNRAPQLAVIATDVDAAEAVVLTNFTDRDDMLGSIHASGLLPLLAGPPLELRGRRWLDGGILQPVPVAAAAALGATHAIVLATRPLGTGPSTGPVDRVVVRHLYGLNPDLAAAYAERSTRYRQTLAEIGAGSSAGVATLLMAPEVGSPLPSRLERSPARLKAAQRAQASSARDQLTELGLLA